MRYQRLDSQDLQGFKAQQVFDNIFCQPLMRIPLGKLAAQIKLAVGHPTSVNQKQFKKEFDP